MTRYVFLFYLIHGWCNAQYKSDKVIHLYGRITGSDTKIPLQYAHIYSTGSSRGTVSNSSGDYVLNTINHGRVDTIVFSFIGYKTVKIILTKVDTLQEINAFLTSEQIILPEVVVSNFNETQILNKLWTNISSNYGLEAYITRGFYREWTKATTSNDFSSYSEGIIDILKNSKNPNEDSVKIVKAISYKSDSIVKSSKKYHSIPEITEGPYVGLWIDAVKNPDLFIYNMAHYKFKIIDMTSYQDRNVYILYFKPKQFRGKGKFEGKIYVDSETFALVKAEFKPLEWVIAHYNTYLSNLLLEQRNYIVEYSSVNDRWYVKFAMVRNTYKVKNSKVRLQNKMYFSGTEPFNKDFVDFSKNKNTITILNSFTSISKILENQKWSMYNTIKTEEIIDK